MLEKSKKEIKSECFPHPRTISTELDPFENKFSGLEEPYIIPTKIRHLILTFFPISLFVNGSFFKINFWILISQNLHFWIDKFNTILFFILRKPVFSLFDLYGEKMDE